MKAVVVTGRLLASAALVVCAAGLFGRLQKKTAFGQWSRVGQQIVIGLAFGVLAVLSTEFGIPIDGATINVRDAAPLTAGLLFGGPAGIISGVLGGAERWFAAGWGAGLYTRDACAAATVCAGFIGALLHRVLFTKQRPSWWYALTIACGVEVLHMLLIFLTNMEDAETAFAYVRRCALIMIAGNGLAVMGAAIVVRGRHADGRAHRLEHVLQTRLFACVVAALAATTLFTWILQDAIVSETTLSQLRVALRDIPQEVSDIVDSGLIEYTDWMSEEVGAMGTPDDESLAAVADSYDIPDVFILAGSEIAYSSDSLLAGRDLAEVPRARALLAAQADPAYVSELEPSFFNPALRLKYAAVPLKDGRRLVAGYDAAFLAQELQRRIELGALHRHIGLTGYVLLADEDGRIVSGPADRNETLLDMGFSLDIAPREVHETVANGIPVYFMYAAIDTVAGRYTGLAAQPVEEATFSASLTIWLSVFFEILIFLVLLIQLTVLLRKRVVREMHAVNDVLGRITSGQLNETVDVRSSDEFAMLSDHINATTTTLKGYIAQAAARVDQELEFARTVQRAALPAVFPPYPERTDFDLYATMDAAKSIGGDFYDFYLRSDSALVFLIADVSGKGIPAAMFMMRSMTQLRNLAQSGLDPAEVFRRANNALCEQNDAQMFLTAWMGILDLTTGLLRYVNAGHNPVLLRDPDGTVRFIRGNAGFVLAGIEDFPYEEGHMELRPGQAVLLYTDGVTEAENSAGEQFGADRLLDSARQAPDTAKGLCTSIRDAVDMFSGNEEQFDDLTLLAVRVNALVSSQRITVMARDASEPVRAYTARRLAQMNVPPADAARIAEELSAAVQDVAARGEVEVSLHRTDDAVVADVAVRADNAPKVPSSTRAEVDKLQRGAYVLHRTWPVGSS